MKGYTTEANESNKHEVKLEKSDALKLLFNQIKHHSRCFCLKLFVSDKKNESLQKPAWKCDRSSISMTSLL